ncbi:urate hydroxylase PuuD [Teredinibacter franksiae]|jgi:Predicted membrane protein|uniref:urate hydroxylase PuuD n=1 Tax=Teredinibacter franksiae TaxID=2761453 RepID=UPI00162817DE|nr:urate hydroxylase PuuD [Teredinibacter franksiae]
MEIVDFLFRWMHVLFGLVWVGMLYYFNFVQTEYFKEAEPAALTDVKAKLAPRALWWFRWGAMLTFVTGLILFGGVQHKSVMNDYIILGATLGTLMFLNVWFIIWPKQKIILGLAEGDASAAAPKAALASRTNTLFSGPMLFCMLASPHLGYSVDYLVAAEGAGIGLWVSLALTILLQINAMVGKLGPLASIRGVIHMSIMLTAVLFLINLFL